MYNVFKMKNKSLVAVLNMLSSPQYYSSAHSFSSASNCPTGPFSNVVHSVRPLITQPLKCVPPSSLPR